MLFLFLWIVCLWFVLWIMYQKAIINSLLLFIQSEQIVKNNLHEILLSKLMHFFLLLCMIFMFFVHILLIWSEVWIVQILCFISCHQLNQQSTSLFHFQQLWIVMMILVCWLNHLSRIITDWHEMLNEFSFLMIIQVCIHMSLSFV